MSAPDAPQGPVTSRGYLLANRVGGGLIMVFGIWIGVQGIGYGLVRNGLPDAGLFPTIVGGLLAVLGASLLVFAHGEAVARGEDSTLPDRKGAIALAVTAVAVTGFLLLLEPLGYVGAMILFLIAVLKTVSALRLWSVLLTAVLFSVGTFYAFDAGLGVPLPHSHLVPLAVLGF